MDTLCTTVKRELRKRVIIKVVSSSCKYAIGATDPVYANRSHRLEAQPAIFH